MMKTQHNPILYIIAAIMMLAMGFLDLSAFSRTAYADEPAVVADPQSLMDTNAAGLFALINAARQNPLETAASLGMDRQQVLDSLPGLADILTGGLAPLVFNDRLQRTAGDHNREMLANSYYAYESLDGRTVDQRLRDAGYAPTASGESISLIFFKNFIGSDRAVFQIFEKMFKDELSATFEGQRKILNPALKELGVSVEGGVFNFDRFSANAYIATCDFGARVETYELQLLNLINQARNNPGAVAAFNGVDVDLFVTTYPEFAGVFAGSLPPVQFNRPLYLSAEMKINDILGNGYAWDAVSTGLALDQRIFAAGYPAEWAAESLVRTSTCDIPASPLLTVSRIFNQLFSAALRTDESRDVNMLSERAMDAGCRIAAAESAVLGNLCGDHVHVTAGDFGAGLVKGNPVITGVVFTDVNGNNLYDAGEEVTDAAITIQGAGLNEGGFQKKVISDSAGSYSVSVTPGLYLVSVGEGEKLQLNWVQIETANMWQVFKIIPDTPAASDGEADGATGDFGG